MRVLQSLIRWYVQASFHVALALLCFLAFTAGITGVEVPRAYYGLLFFASVAGYNAIKYGAEPWKRGQVFRSRSRRVLAISVMSLLVALAFALFVSLQTLLLLACAAAVAALYALPVLPGFRNFRSFGLVKVPLVALVWVHLTVWIPLWEQGPFHRWDLVLEGVQRGLWVCLLMLPFEIRDMATDPPQLRTWPRRWGLPTTRKIGWVGALVFALMTLLKDSLSGPELLVKVLAALFMGWAIGYQTRKKKGFFAALWVEAVPIASFLLWKVLDMV